jgi:5-formyltetrahydrofolate cyclo-ligase
VVAPVTDFEKNQLSHVKVESVSTLVPNKWGVPEPKNGQKIDVATLDLVLVPLLAIDNKGNRLGYGKGFYDRFLKKTTAQRIGLVFSNFVLDEVPSEPFDEQLDGYFTENGLRYLKQ